MVQQHSIVLFVSVFCSLTLGLQGKTQASTVTESPRPNVLLICIDDLRPVLGCYGGAAKTPHLDRFAESAETFQRHYVQFPSCGPSRASMFGGVRPDTLQLYGNGGAARVGDHPDTRPTMPLHFRNHGYTTLSFGKTYHGKGAGEGFGWSRPPWHPESGWTCYVDFEYKSKQAWRPAFEIYDGPDHVHGDYQTADQAIHAIEENRDHPFFIAAGFYKPHLPFVAPQRYWDLYDDDEIEQIAPLGIPDGAITHGYAFREICSYGYVDGDQQKFFTPESLPTSSQAKDLIHAYYAAVSFNDAQVGRILKRLDELGLSENTAVTVWSDHGFHLGDQARWAKWTQFESDMRSPLMIRLPGTDLRPRSTDALVEAVDLYPTLADYCQIGMPEHFILRSPCIESNNMKSTTTHLFIFLLGAAIPAVGADSRPNILFIHMEDMGCEIPAYGDRTVATPNLDRLAADGVVFERAHVTAATCAASRGSIFSGLYPHQNGIMGFVSQHGFHYRHGIPTFVSDLKNAGYKTGLTYKTGVESSRYRKNPVPFDFHPKYNDNYLTGQTGKKAADPETAALASFSVDNFQYFLENVEPGKPFYFQSQTPDTHHPWNRPHFIREGDPGWPYPEVDIQKIQRTPGWGEALPPTGSLRKAIADYYRAIQRTDWFVGRILDLLEQHGHAEDTLVIFSADHGPSHLLRGKITPYESGLRVPFIVRWPGQVKQPGSRSEALVSFVDLYPTFMDAAGLDIPKHLPGHSILPVLKGGEPARRYLYSAYVAHTTGMDLYWPTRTVTDGSWKLIHHVLADGMTDRYKEKDRAMYALHRALKELPVDSLANRVARRSSTSPAFELYDLQADPDELHNLIGQARHAGVEQRLKAQLHTWRKDVVSDPFLDPTFVADFSATYRTNYDLWLSLGGNKMKDRNALDFERYIPAWDATPYNGLRD